MVTPFLLAGVAQAMSPAEIDEIARELLGPEQVSNRVDCTRRDAVTADFGPSPRREEASEIYLFPLRPHRQTAEVRSRVRYITTMNDGRSFIREGRIESIEWQRWPHFSARPSDRTSTAGMEQQCD